MPCLPLKILPLYFFVGFSQILMVDFSTVDHKSYISKQNFKNTLHIKLLHLHIFRFFQYQYIALSLCFMLLVWSGNFWGKRMNIDWIILNCIPFYWYLSKYLYLIHLNVIEDEIGFWLNPRYTPPSRNLECCIFSFNLSLDKLNISSNLDATHTSRC